MSYTTDQLFTISRAILSLRPGAQYRIDGIAEQLIWLDTVQSRPSDEEIQAAMNALPPIIADISRRQLFQQLATLGLITPAEALATTNGTIPAVIMTKINTLSTNQQLLAKMYIGGETSFKRRHPYIDLIGDAFGYTSTQVDNFFQAAALL